MSNYYVGYYMTKRKKRVVWRCVKVVPEEGVQHITIVNNWKAPGNNHVTAISSEIFKYVRIHPNFASRPVSCGKMFPCCFFPSKQGEKTWHTGLKFCLPTPPPPPPHTHTHPTPPLLLPPEKMLNLDTRDMDTLCYTAKELLRFF